MPILNHIRNPKVKKKQFFKPKNQAGILNKIWLNN